MTALPQDEPPATLTSAIEFAEVSVKFGETLAVDSVDLGISSGTTTTLIGPSGCGKTTLLRLAIGLQQASSGDVRVLGHAIRSGDLNRLRHSIGYVVQEGGLFPHLSCADNASLVARHLGWARDEIDKRMGELAELVRLPEELLSRAPGQLSGGQRQRVGLMRALFLDPELLLLDEPLAALDPIVRAELQSDLKQIFARLNKSVVLVTHDLAEAGYLGSEIILLRAGRIVQRGDLRQLFEEPAEPFVTQFVNAQRGARELLAEAQA